MIFNSRLATVPEESVSATQLENNCVAGGHLFSWGSTNMENSKDAGGKKYIPKTKNCTLSSLASDYATPKVEFHWTLNQESATDEEFNSVSPSLENNLISEHESSFVAAVPNDNSRVPNFRRSFFSRTQKDSSGSVVCCNSFTSVEYNQRIDSCGNITDTSVVKPAQTECLVRSTSDYYDYRDSPEKAVKQQFTAVQTDNSPSINETQNNNNSSSCDITPKNNRFPLCHVTQSNPDFSTPNKQYRKSHTIVSIAYPQLNRILSSSSLKECSRTRYPGQSLSLFDTAECQRELTTLDSTPEPIRMPTNPHLSTRSSDESFFQRYISKPFVILACACVDTLLNLFGP